MWFIFSGMGSQWPGMLSNLIEISVFRERMEHLDSILKPFKINLIDALLDKSGQTLKSPKISLISIIAVEVQLNTIDLSKII